MGSRSRPPGIRRDCAPVRSSIGLCLHACQGTYPIAIPRESNAKSQQTPSSKQADKAKKNLDDKYSYLAGNAFGRDKKGRVKKEDPNEMHGVEGGGAEYTAYVYYDFEFN